MIPTTLDSATRERYASNLRQAWQDSNALDRCLGLSWYPTAHDLAIEVGHGDARVGAGVIAALSPQVSWDRNVKLARDVGNGQVHGHFGLVLSHVRAILDGADPEEVLPIDKKTGNFYRNILDPGDPCPITIDRHAHDVAIGQAVGNANRGLGNARRYAALASLYRETALDLGVPGPVLQATVWGHWRRIIHPNQYQPAGGK